MHLLATTVGLGPFNPAIKLNDKTYVLNETYADEDKALAIANGVCAAIDEIAFEIIDANGFESIG